MDESYNSFSAISEKLRSLRFFSVENKGKAKKKIVIFFRRTLIYKKCQVPWEIAFRYFEYFDNQELCLPNAF